VPFFRGAKPPQPTEEEQRAADVDLERIRQGGIPLGAEQRLKRVATTTTPFFSSDLSAKEFALAQASGLQPVAQVMGSSVVQHGWVGAQSGLFFRTGEIRALSEPWNMARDRAFGRLVQEAALADSDGVIGIEMNARNIGDAGNLELVVFGTAVRETMLPRRGDGSLGLCTLSGQEVDKLRRIGAEIRGAVGHTSVQSVQLSNQSSWIMNSGAGMLGGGGGRMNAEIPEIAEGVYAARNRVMLEIKRQGNELGANDIVVSTLAHTIEHHEYEQGGFRYHFFHVTMNVLGTAIRLGAHEPHPGPFYGPGLTINLGAE
jgi:uncharacterized protein YbjQ (UPF0145 family)